MLASTIFTLPGCSSPLPFSISPPFIHIHILIIHTTQCKWKQGCSFRSLRWEENLSSKENCVTAEVIHPFHLLSCVSIEKNADACPGHSSELFGKVLVRSKPAWGSFCQFNRWSQSVADIETFESSEESSTSNTFRKTTETHQFTSISFLPSWTQDTETWTQDMWAPVPLSEYAKVNCKSVKQKARQGTFSQLLSLISSLLSLHFTTTSWQSSAAWDRLRFVDPFHLSTSIS